ncbi:MAG: MarR family winged helix-turn-helix transcriptional regulator [Oscillospiraceae bacterium]
MNIRNECVNLLYEIYPYSRKVIIDVFEKFKMDFTKTQQLIIMVLAEHETLSMSQLAEKISTSNEQATRAVAQLVENGYVVRKQNKNNRRIVNISLTELALKQVELLKQEIIDNLFETLDLVSDEEMQEFYNALNCISKVFKKIK